MFHSQQICIDNFRKFSQENEVVQVHIGQSADMHVSASYA